MPRLRASVLPFCFYEGESYYLLGKETDGKWGDFGGGVEFGETIEDAAMRELVEESMGFLGNEELIQPGGHAVIYLRDSTTHTFFAEIEFDPFLPRHFSNVLKFFSQCTRYTDEWGTPIIPTCPSGYLEKKEIAWFAREDFLLLPDEEISPVLSALLWEMEERSRKDQTGSLTFPGRIGSPPEKRVEFIG